MKQLTVGDIIKKLESIDDDRVLIHFDDGSFPGALMSWRGIYAELAFDRSRGADAPLLQHVLLQLRGAVGAKFTGYKGGKYEMSKGTPVWVSDYGSAEETAIVDVVEENGWVVLKTEHDYEC